MDLRASSKLSRRTVLIAGGAVTSAFALGGARAATLPQSAVAYQTSPKGDNRCDNCKLFIAPASCKSVSGKISASGWCKLWVKAG